MKASVLAGVCALAACSDPPAKPPSKPVPVAVAEAKAAPAEPTFRGARITQLSGEIASTPPAAVGERLKAGQRLRLSVGAALQLALESGVRVDVKGPALLAAAARSDQGIHLGRGTLRVELPPGGADPSEGTAFVATPLASILLGRSARFLLRVAPSGHARLAVVSGRVSVDSRGSGAKQQQLTVDAGRFLDLDRDKPVVEKAGPTTLDAAERALADQAVESESAAGFSTGWLTDRLAVAFAAAELEATRQRSLDLEHQSAHKARAPNVMEIQRNIAEQAATAYRARRELEAVLLQLESALLSAAPEAVPDPLVGKAQALLR